MIYFAPLIPKSTYDIIINNIITKLKSFNLSIAYVWCIYLAFCILQFFCNY